MGAYFYFRERSGGGGRAGEGRDGPGLPGDPNPATPLIMSVRLICLSVCPHTHRAHVPVFYRNDLTCGGPLS